MLIMAIHKTPSLTQERYEEVVRRLTKGKSHLDDLSDLPFGGLVVHFAGQAEDGFYVVDVFESQEALDHFREIVTPIAQEVGIKVPPEFFPTHTFVST